MKGSLTCFNTSFRFYIKGTSQHWGWKGKGRRGGGYQLDRCLHVVDRFEWTPFFALHAPDQNPWFGFSVKPIFNHEVLILNPNIKADEISNLGRSFFFDKNNQQTFLKLIVIRIKRRLATFWRGQKINEQSFKHFKMKIALFSLNI